MKIYIHGSEYGQFEVPGFASGVTTLDSYRDGAYPVKDIYSVRMYADSIYFCCTLLPEDEHLPKNEDNFYRFKEEVEVTEVAAPIVKDLSEDVPF